jgi:hypothetical protein
MTLALAALAAHLCAGGPRDRNGTIGGIVIVDEDFGRRQRFTEIGDHRCDCGFLVEAWHQDGNPDR